MAHSNALDPSIPLEDRYPGRPRYILDKVREHEDELDQIWPNWRERKPFDRVDYALKARIKWLLKRHAMLTRTEGGVPAPQDWDVLIVRDGRNPNKCYAHPVLPTDQKEDAVTRNPRSPLEACHQASRPEPGSTEDIAGKLGISVSSVTRALDARPDDWAQSDLEWVKQFRSPPAPLPAPLPAKIAKKTTTKKTSKKLVEESVNETPSEAPDHS